MFSSFRFASLKYWQAALFLFLATVLLFWNFLSPSGHILLSKMGEDLSGQFVWWRQFGFEQLRQGHLALWNPKLFAGEPYFGGFQSALLYPPNWLFMFLPLTFALNSSIAFHVFLAGFFTYLWIKFRGSHPASALMAALMMMFGAAMILHIVPGHLPNLCTMAWIPLVFLSVDICAAKKDLRWVLLGMFAIAMQVFSGHIQYVYYTASILVFYVLFLLIQMKEGKTAFLGRMALMGLGAGALSAVQLLAGWVAAGESARAKVLDIDFIDIADISPERLWCLLMPNFFDGWQNYWGGGIYWEGPVFVSMTAFVLALLALFVSRHKDKAFFGCLALILILIGVGKRTPLFGLFCKFFPLFSSFRGVGKLNIFITLCLVVLGALGLDEIFQNPQKLTGFKKWIWRGCGLFSLLSLAFYATPRLGGGRVFKNYLSHAGSMSLSLVLCAITLALIGLIAQLASRKPLWRYGFLILAFGELFFFATSNLPFFDSNQLNQQVSVIESAYQKDPGDYRVFTGVNNYPLGTSGFSAWGDDPVVPLRYDEFTSRTKSLRSYYHDFNEPLHDYPKVLGMARLKYAFYEKDGQLVPQKLDLVPVPRAFLVSDWQKASLDNVWPQILSPSFNPLKQVWLEQDPGIASNPNVPGKVSLEDISTDAVEIKAVVSKPAMLVMSDNYSQSWKAAAYADSVQNVYQVMPANGFQKAIPLTTGSHHFLLEYRPKAFVIGAWISWAAWVLFLGFFFFTVPLSTRPKRL